MSFHRGFDIQGDLALTADGRDLMLVSNEAKVLQNIRVRAAIYKGSWRYDRNVGVPYFDDILVAGPSVELVRRRFYELLIGTDGVSSVQSLTLRFDPTRGTIYADFVVLTTAGQTAADTLDFVSAG